MNVRLNTNHGPLRQLYLDRIDETINRALNEHLRTLAIRVDLRLPVQGDYLDTTTNLASTDSHVISRFFDSLNAQIKADLLSKKRANIRVYPCSLRYVWVKEKNREHKDHYHVLLLLNKDTYYSLGSYSSSQSNMATRIRKAWTNALRVDSKTFAPLIHFPKNPVYYLDRNALDKKFTDVLEDLIYRASYLAKEKTKFYGDGFRSFGCSRR